MEPDLFADWLRFVYQRGFQRAQPARAAAMLEEHPELADACPLAVGLPGNPPPYGMPPLISVTFSGLIHVGRFADALRHCARQLLDEGADPNATWTDPDFPNWPLSALYGAAGLNHDPGMTRILLDYGANPDDNESLYHSVESPDLACTRLLLEYGATVEGTNAVAHMLDYDNLEGLRLLLEHGGEPALMHALRRRRSPEHIRELLNAGAPTEGAWRLAMIYGLPEAAALLPPEPLTPEEAFIAACARGDRQEASRLNRLGSLSEEQLRMLPNLVEAGNIEGARTMVEMGWPIDARGGDWNASALNLAIFRGDAALTRFLLEHGADWRVKHGYNDNALGTLSYASRNNGPGSWLECAQALVEHGTPPPAPGDYEFSPEVTRYFTDAAKTKPSAGPAGSANP
jgi:ankyrin repeat protein